MSKPKKKGKQVFKSETERSYDMISSNKFQKQYSEYLRLGIGPLYMKILTDVKKAANESDINSLENLETHINYLKTLYSPEILQNLCDDISNPLRDTNLIILGCKSNSIRVLKYLLYRGHSTSLFHLPHISRKIAPEDEDDEKHNAFYYAIRSNDVELLELLISKWPNDYFQTKSELLDEILSKAYEELKLKHVLLSDSMDIFVANKLVKLRFFSDSEQSPNETTFNNVSERIEFFLENVNLLREEYAFSDVDDIFLHVSKFILKTVYYLKQQLKCTYDVLPWEEIEFCLIAFVVGHQSREINFVYKSVLSKQKMLTYLESFAKHLSEMKEYLSTMGTNKLIVFPNLKREEALLKISKSCDIFAELCKDFKIIRDIHSLETIRKYAVLAESANSKEKEGQFLIMRSLQVVGEHLKNTLGSPKLGDETGELLFSLFPQNVKQIFSEIRNSFSHAYTLGKRNEIQRCVNDSYFSNIQTDIKNINMLITGILKDCKMKVVETQLQKFVDSKTLKEIEDIAEVFCSVSNYESVVTDYKIFPESENDIIYLFEEFIKGMNKKFIDKSFYEKELLGEIEQLINLEKNYLNVNAKSTQGLFLLKTLSINWKNGHLTVKSISCLKKRANDVLKQISIPRKDGFQKIASLLLEIYDNFSSTFDDETKQQMTTMLALVNHFVKLNIRNIKWIEEFCWQTRINKYKNYFHDFKSDLKEGKLKPYDCLQERIKMLKDVLQNNMTSNDFYKDLQYCENNEILQIIEMLLLDILSLLGDSCNFLTENVYVLENDCPLLIGKCFRNYLAHGNACGELFSIKPARAVVLNAVMFSKYSVTDKKRIGKIIKKEELFLKTKLEQDIITLTHQKQLFQALEKGELEEVKKCIKNGADINARSFDLQTALHFAARAPNLDAVKFVVDQNIGFEKKDEDGQSPLHVAVRYRRKCMVEYLIERTNANVNDCDNFGKTCLHIAAQNGFYDIVQVLIIHKSNVNAIDIEGVKPLFYAAKNNHKDIVSLLLGKGTNIDTPKIFCGFTLLHTAVENGHLELTKFCLRNGADVNSQTDQGAVPLHLATVYGHFNVAEVLISAGGNVNAMTNLGCTPLCNAVEFGHKKLVNLLLQNGAGVNTFGSSYDSPLAFAALEGDGDILEILLAEGAHVNSLTTEGFTALHLAATKGHYNVAQILLHNSASVNIKDTDGYSALHKSSQNGHESVVDLLLNFGAKVNDRTKDNNMPLHLAVVNNQIDIVKNLLLFGASINSVNNKNMSPLHLSCQKGFEGVTKTLIENGACINVKDSKNRTSLHYAVISGIKEVVELLLINQAQLQEKDIQGLTALHYAAVCGVKKILNSLIIENVDINVSNMKNETPLHLAVSSNHTEIVQRLLDEGAEANVLDMNSNTPLNIAVKNNNKEIVSLLISKNVYVSNTNLIDAVNLGYPEIVVLLLRKNKRFDLNMKSDNEMTLLCSAVCKGYRTIAQILVNKGADVNFACGSDKFTPLHVATAGGYKDIVQMLLYKNAKINVKSYGDHTPLHVASVLGYIDIVDVLVNAKADVTLKDDKNRTCVELAVAYNNVSVVEYLSKLEIVDINAKGNGDFTLLHIAAQGGHLEITKFLVKIGANIYAKNSLGSMPIHIAAREGHVQVMDFYLSSQVNINVCGAANQSLLHYAAAFGQIDVMKYLVDRKIEINASDANGSRPIHIASFFGFIEIVLFLLENGAYYDVTDKNFRTPLLMSQSRDIFGLFQSVGELFDGVRSNNFEKVCKSIRAGAVVNVKNTDNVTPLHYAVCKGHVEIATVLLQNEANPNVVGKDGWTLLHYAAKFSHLKIVELLLMHGAMYNVMNDNYKMPCDVAVNGKILELLEKINVVFTNVVSGKMKVIDDLKAADDNTMNIIIKAKDKQGKSLLVNAIHYNFPLIKELQRIIERDIFFLRIKGGTLLQKEKFQDALHVYEYVLEKQNYVLGPDNPCSLDTEVEIAKIYYKLQDYSKALEILRSVYERQKKILGKDNIKSIKTKEHIALTLHRQNNNEEALDIFKEVCQKQEEMLGPNHLEVLGSKIHMGLTLNGLKKYEEALIINRDIFEKSKKLFGFNHHSTLSVYNNIAMVLGNQGKFDDAMDIYKVVYERRRRILGPTHSVTLDTLRRMAQIHLGLQNYDAALEMLDNIFKAQKKFLGLNNFITLKTWCDMADIFFLGKRNSHKALEMYREIYMHEQSLLSPWHPDVLNVLERINTIEMANEIFGIIDPVTEPSCFETAKQGVIKNDKKIIEDLLMKGLDVNETDSEGKTLLHYAVDCAQNLIVSFLLENKADCTIVTKKGNTPLHIACLKSYEDIVEILLQHVKKFNESQLLDFVNAATFSSSSTALHVTRNIKIAKALLKCGAIFNKINKEGKKPIDLVSDPAVIGILKLLEESFEDVYAGNSEIINTLLQMDFDMFLVITNAQNSEGKTLIQVAKLRNHHHIVNTIINVSSQHKMNVYNNYDEYPRNMGLTNTEFIEIKNVNELCKFIVGKDSSDPFCILRNAERFMIQHQHMYDQAVKVFKKLLKIQPKEFGFVFLEIRGLITEGSSDDFGMHHKIVDNNFHNAACAGEMYVLKHFLAEGFNVNTQDCKGRTALHYAANNKQNCVIYFLLENGADCLLTTDKGNTALHIASSKGHGEIVEILLQHMKLVNLEKLRDLVDAKNTAGTTALHVAPDLRITMALLRCGATYNAVNNAGQLPIDLVKDQEIVSIFKLLNKIFEAVYKGNSEVIDIFSHIDPLVLTAIANVRNHEGKTISQLALIKNLPDIAYVLINTLKSYKNLEETRILRYFIMDKHEDEITDLKKKICDIHSGLPNFHRAQLIRIQELFFSCQKIYEMAVKSYEMVLKTLGLKVNGSNYVLNELKNDCSIKPCLSLNFLHQTVSKFVDEGDVEALGKVLADKYDIDYKDSEGKTLLHRAVINSQKGIVHFLLTKGASCVNISFDGNTPLHLASSKGDSEVVEMLIEYVKKNNNNQLDTLVNKRNTFSGNTALHVAANFEIVKMLLKNGGGYDIINEEGNSPIDLHNEEKTVYMLGLIDNLFKDAHRGDLNIPRKLKQCNYEDFTLIVNTLNNQRKSILDILEDGNHSFLLHEIRDLQKISNQDLLDIVEPDSNYLLKMFPNRLARVVNWTYCTLL